MWLLPSLVHLVIGLVLHLGDGLVRGVASTREERATTDFFKRWYHHTDLLVDRKETRPQEVEIRQQQVADGFWAPHWKDILNEESEFFEGWYGRAIGQDGSSVAAILGRFSDNDNDATSLVVVLIQQAGELQTDVVFWVGPSKRMVLNDLSADSKNPSDFSVLVDSPSDFHYIKKPSSSSHSSLLRSLRALSLKGMATSEEEEGPALLHAKLTSMNRKQLLEVQWQESPGGGGSSVKSLSIHMEDGVMWNSIGTTPSLTSPLGPQSFAIYSNLPETHWFVYSVDSLAQVTLTESSPSIRSTTDHREDVIIQQGKEKMLLEITNGNGHLEKNWGDFFPDKWIWVQGIRAAAEQTAGPSGSLVLAGGPMPIEGVSNFPNAPVVFLSGFRWCQQLSEEEDEPSSCVSYSFGPALSMPFTVDHSIDGCAGVVDFIFRDAKRELHMRIAAPLESFSADFPAPNKDEPNFSQVGAMESFMATATVQVFELAGIDRKDLILTADFENVALEFGGLYRC